MTDPDKLEGVALAEAVVVEVLRQTIHPFHVGGSSDCPEPCYSRWPDQPNIMRHLYVRRTRADTLQEYRPDRDIEAAMEALDSLPRDREGLDRWYWKLTCTPLNYRMQLWYADTDKWNLGTPCVTAEAAAKEVAISRAILKAVRWKREQSDG